MLRTTLPTGLIVEGRHLARAVVAAANSNIAGSSRMRYTCSPADSGDRYVRGDCRAFQGERGHRLLAPLAAWGRMAPYNYLTQSLGWVVLFGVGPGLALAGSIGTARWQASWWHSRAAGRSQPLVLGRYAYGPAEWAWRALTLWRRPAMMEN